MAQISKSQVRETVFSGIHD